MFFDVFLCVLICFRCLFHSISADFGGSLGECLGLIFGQFFILARELLVFFRVSIEQIPERLWLLLICLNESVS